MTFECEVTGTVSLIVWTGTAFMCPASNNEIAFLHSRFNNTTTATGNCSNIIIGEIIEANGNNYISYLNVTVIPSLVGKTAKCIRDDGVNTSVIVNYTITNDTSIVLCQHHCNTIINNINSVLLCSQYPHADDFK